MTVLYGNTPFKKKKINIGSKKFPKLELNAVNGNADISNMQKPTMGTTTFELIKMPSFTTPAFELTQMPSFTTTTFGLTQVLFFRAKVHNL